MRQHAPPGALTPNQETFLRAYVTSSTVEAAAKTAGVSRRTATRWLQEPDFQAALRDISRGLLGESTDHLQRLTVKAAATLEKLLDDPRAAPVVKMQVALKVLEFGFRISEADLAARIEALEAAERARRELEATKEPAE